MKFWSSTFQMFGIALLASALIRVPMASPGIFWGIWLIITAYIMTFFFEKD